VLTLRTPALLAAAAALFLTALPVSRASAEAMLLIEADTGKVLHAEKATYPWYPASVTKLLTAYLTLQAVKNGRITLDTLLTVSARAAAQQPSKMGFKPGTTVTVDNTLKMLMVKSANDVAVVLAEGVSGSIEKFADEMNNTSRRLGMTQSSWVNPNGLPAENQISSARDLAILARATIRDFPEYDLYWHVPAIRFGKKVMRNTNSLIARYPGADGMKTGFICASGFNVAATATRNGKRLIAVVLGSPSSAVRAVKTAALLERGFNGGGLGWLTPSLGNVEALTPIDASPPDLRDNLCGSHRKRPAAEDADEDLNLPNAAGEPGFPNSFLLSSLSPGSVRGAALLTGNGTFNPMVVHTGPAKVPAENQFAAIRAKLGITDTKRVATPAKNSKDRKVAVAAPDRAAKPAPAAATPGGFVPGAAPIAPPPSHFAPVAPGPADAPTLSFAAPASAEPAPLTAVPPVTHAASVPMPRPRPKIAAPKH
jgi:D-alanyl-D-alanine carboxypeptidase